ncbi:uncharacterized protein LOC116256695 isoform X2 [Nymphaea colorata]|uniref:uncharacterized protein LOC116256695 isoform X2 n=1 Tax=Nymphaea colorata TaxID=210225 RepID=UPI00129E2DF1|nr:uncharacterized protein LOC116256695 isoform X2 [Nymphaea colorata]
MDASLPEITSQGDETRQPSWKRNLGRQLAEVEALKSIYGADGEFEFDEGVDEILKNHAESVADSILGELHISFTIHLLAIKIGGSHISARFYMPRGYPEVEPLRVTIQCGGVSRYCYEMLENGVRDVALKLIGEEAGFQVLQLIQENAEVVADQISQDLLKKEIVPGKSLNRPIYVKRVLIWFHHVKSVQKRKSIIEWSKDMTIGGFLKSGFPGILLVEGERSAIDAYVKQIQSLHWQAMCVRAEEEEEVQNSSEIENFRCLPHEVQELEELGGMSELGRRSKEANLEHLFLSSLKISR